MKKGWEYKTLGDCCEIYNGNSINADYKKKNFAGRKEGYPFIATKDVSFNGIINYDIGIKIPYDTNFKIAYPESVFICAEGGSAGRKIALVNEKVCFGNKLFCISPINKTEFIGKYIYYYMNSAFFQKQFQSLLTGLIGGVSAKKFKEIIILNKSFEEQRRIVSYLDSSFDLIDKIKENASKSLSEAKALFQSALAEAMEPKEGWEEKTLGELCSKLGSGATPKGGKKIYIKNGVSLIRSLNVHKTYFKYEDLAHIDDNSAKKLDNVIVKNNDVLFNITGASIARCCVVPKDVLPARVNQHVSIIRIKDGIVPNFLCYLLNSKSYQMILLGIGESGSTRQAITKSNLEHFVIAYPPLDTQKQIVAHLDNLSSKVKQIEEKYQKMIAECDAMKQAMLREVFE